MRRFNPEKELYKIQHGNKNKIILFVFSLLVVGIMGYSFALYQVRYSKRIIYTKVAPFSKHDIQLAVSLDGKPLTSVPEKGTAYYESITCDDDETAEAGWDYTNWKLGAISVTIPNKCTINFTTQPSTLIDLIDYDYHNNPEIVIEDDTVDKNLRYIGQNPNNYIWFNCDSYDDLSQETAEQHCEKWRIIGLMNNMTIIDETTQGKISNQRLVKIIRADSVGDMVWDKTGGQYGSNNWNRPADLQTSLTNYYNGRILGSAKEIKELTKGMIEQVTWNIGAYNTDSVTAQTFYDAERIGSTWPGYIGLLSVSDYGYAADKSCWSTNLNTYNSSCYNSDWLFISTDQWTLTPNSSGGHYVYIIYRAGNVFGADGASATHAIRPSLYLTSSVKVKSEAGDGSSGTPYILIP